MRVHYDDLCVDKHSQGHTDGKRRLCVKSGDFDRMAQARSLKLSDAIIDTLEDVPMQ